jgi:hypothetical protein
VRAHQRYPNVCHSNRDRTSFQEETTVPKAPELDRESEATPSTTPQSQGTAPSSAAQQPTPAAIAVDTSKAHAAYANFCRVTGTPEELIIDFGLNSQPMGATNEPIEIAERIVMNYYTAKRMLAALQMSVQRHEGAFGVLEINVQKRLQGFRG